MLGESGILSGAAKAIYNLPSVSMTTDYDPHDWSYNAFQKFGAREISLDLTGSFSIKRFLSRRDLIRQYQEYKSGNYTTFNDFFQGLAKQIATSVNVRRNVLIMEALYEQGKQNGIEEINIEYPKDMSQITAFSAREQYFDKLFDIYSDFQTAISYIKGYIGQKANDFLCLISINKLYKLQRAITLAGSDQAYSDLKAGNVAMIQGLESTATHWKECKPHNLVVLERARLACEVSLFNSISGDNKLVFEAWKITRKEFIADKPQETLNKVVPLSSLGDESEFEVNK